MESCFNPTLLSIEELEDILRADARGPERSDSDIDEILQIMEALAQKRREAGLTGKSAQEALKDFYEHYYPYKTESSIECKIIPPGRLTCRAPSF